jgi:predicted transcriptional regulator
VNIYEAAAQHNAALAVAEMTKAELVDVMRKCNSAGMSIVELAKISGFSRPTVMKYVQDATTATVEA